MRIINFIVNSSLFIACCSLSLTMVTLDYTQHLIVDNWPIMAFVFCSTFAAYRLHYLLKRNSELTDRNDWNQQHFIFNIVSLLITLGVNVYCIFQMNIVQHIFIAITVILTLAYSFPLLKKQKTSKRIKDYGLLKPFYLALVWTIATAILPLLGIHHFVWQVFLLRFFTYFLLMLPLCILFDFKDVQLDLSNGIHTLAAILDRKKTLVLNTVLVTINIIIQVYSHSSFLIPVIITSLLILVLTYVLFQKDTNERFYLFYIDGCMLVFSIIYFLTTL